LDSLRIYPGIEMPGYGHRVAPRRQIPLVPVVQAIVLGGAPVKMFYQEKLNEMPKAETL
jgi:hypothetical protein